MTRKAKPPTSRPPSKRDVPGQELEPEPTVASVVSKTELRKAGLLEETKSERRRKKRTAKKNEGLPMVACRICSHEARCLTTHLKQIHGLTGKQYKAQNDNAPVFAPDLLDGFRASGKVGAANNWNHFCKLYNWSTDQVRDKVIATLEKDTGITLLQVKDGLLDD